MLGEGWETDLATGDGGMREDWCFTGEADDQASWRGTLNPQQLFQLFLSNSVQFHYCLPQQGHVIASFWLLEKTKLKKVFIILYLLIHH